MAAADGDRLRGKLRNARMPYVDQNDALHKIHLIDRISIALFGRSVYFERVCDGPKETVWVVGNDLGLLNRLLLQRLSAGASRPQVT